MTTFPVEDPVPSGLPDTATGTGNELRDARIRAGLSEQEVAKELRLDTDTIRYLEEEDYERLPAPAFVRGYLRNYASLLGVPPEPLVRAFNRRGLPPPPLKADITPSQALTASWGPIRIATYGVLLCAAILTAVHLYNQNPKADNGVDKMNSASIDQREQPLSESNATALAAEGLAAPDQPPSEASIEDVATNDPERRTTSIPSLPSDGSGATQRPESATPYSPINDPTARASPPVVQGKIPADAKTPAQNHLAMRFVHDSWVEIYDGQEKRLYYRLVKGGESLTLAGAAPFRVLLGYAKDVAIEYNGRPFDERPFIHPQGLARFTLGVRSEAPTSGRNGSQALLSTPDNNPSTVRP
jgi:cytoskeleton protein RodZ